MSRRLPGSKATLPTGAPRCRTPGRRCCGRWTALGRRAYQKGLLTFVWRAEDENRDELIYDVLYRREGETSWKPLRRDLKDEIFVWDTTSVPNGRYVVQILASDLPSNAPDAALAGSMESTTFEIDNTPPAVTVTNSAATVDASPSNSTCVTRTPRFRKSRSPTATAGRRSIRETASPIRGSSSSSWFWRVTSRRAVSSSAPPMR